MDKFYWKTLQENNYTFSADQTPTSLTAELFTYLGSTDSELRDDIAYDIFANFLERDYFSLEEIEIYIANLLANLETGIGDTESDSVFLRSFSALFLAEIVHNDNKSPRLEKPLLKTILEKGLWYLAEEKDPRAYVAGKGWAHALAHIADLLLVLGKSPSTGQRDHSMILNDIRAKLTRSTNWIYHHGEDDRTARAVLEVLHRNTLSETFLKKWLQSFLEPEDGSWKGVWTDEKSSRAFFNVRNFLRSLHIQVETEEKLENQAQIQELLLETIRSLKPY